MLRPREALAQHCVRMGIADSFAKRFDRFHYRGRDRTIALIDGVPDLETEALIGANVVTRSWVDGPVAQPDSHTTFAACVLVGQRDGLVPRARLLAAAVTTTEGRIVPARIAAAIDWARQSGAQVIVIPLADHHDHADVREAVNVALAADILIVAAAGNAHPHPLMFPARVPGVIAVGACDEHGELLEDSCRAPRLDLVVPGRSIFAAIGPGREATRSGTSVAAALAGGLLTLELGSFIDPDSQKPEQEKPNV
jgi:subtilisin family serine protease